jgi:hypothetical protein
VIPIAKGSKAPVSDAAGFNEWATTRQPAELIERWDETYKGHGIGVICGPVSNICVLDVDTLKPDIIACLPLSPVIRRGKEGRLGALFFRHNPEIRNHSFKRVVDGVEDRIDVLVERKYIIVPPSVHPETGKKYQWVTPDTLENMPASDLPMLLPEHLDRIAELFGQDLSRADARQWDLTGLYDSPDGARCAHGSHDRLRTLAGALISRRASVHEAVVELVRYDQDHHLRVAYFRDPRRGSDFGADPYSNALRFYSSILKTVNTNHLRRGEEVEIPAEAQTLSVVKIDIVVAPTPKPFVPMELPEPGGFIKDVRDLIIGFSKRRQPALALAGAVAVGSALVANKFKLGRNWPNLYVLALAPTGSGKSFPVEAAKRLLAVDHETGLLGYGAPMSGQAFLKNLSTKRERLDVVDECSNLFNMISRGGVFQQDLIDLMCQLYSDSSSLFLGPETKAGETVRVFHPCVSSLMLTNQEGLLLSATRSFITKGLFPRCLILADDEYGRINENPEWDAGLAAKIGSTVESLLRVPVAQDEAHKDLLHPKPMPREVGATAGALDVLKAHDRRVDEETADSKTPEIRRHMLSRQSQTAHKLALVHGVLRGGSVEREDALWAVDLCEAALHNAMPVVEKISAQTPMEAAVVGILELVRRKGAVRPSELYEATRFLSKSQRNDALEALRIEGKVQLIVDNTGQVYVAT